MSTLTTRAADAVRGATPTTINQPIRALLPLAMTQKRLLGWTILAGTCYQLAAIAAAVLSGTLIGLAATGHPASELVPVLWLLGGSVIAAAAVRWWQMWVAHDFAYRLLAELRVRAFAALARIAPRFLLGRRTGELAATVMGDVEVTERFYAHTLADYVVAVVVTAAAIGGLGVLNPLLALALTPFALAVATVPYWLGMRASVQGDRLRAELAILNAEVVDGVQGLRELVGFGAAKAYAHRLAARTRTFQALQLAYGRRGGLEQAATDAVQALGLLAVLAAAAALAGAGRLELARFPVAVVLAAYALGPLAEVTQTARELGQIRASARRVFSVLDHRSAIHDTATTAPALTGALSVAFDKVVFRYDAEREEALAGVSFRVEPGERVALVGHSGAGKSTCANLLLRFWDPDTGTVRLGGVDLRDWPADAVREHVALVPQEVYLFTVSIRDNIRLGRPDATDADVETAARQALAHEFILAELPQGYDTVCGERGAQLSGGQRQRIAIARALLKDTPVLLMDEAVSNLDAENEQALRTAMAQAARGRTTLLIAHRLSTIRSADRIVVLHRGRVAQTGTHTELLAAGGAYANLIAAQHNGVIGT
ncbi:MAG: ABC transporter ATP-binding protein [Pseudonocardiaceae bacterium]